MKHADEKRSAASARRSGAKAPDSVKHDGGDRARAAVPTRTATQTRTSRKARPSHLRGPGSYIATIYAALAST